MEEYILYEFRNIVEESRIEDNTDYYMKLRDTLDFIENLLTKYKQLEQENNNYKAAALKNDDLYKEVCNKNKKLEELVEYLRRSCERKDETIIEAQQECIDSIPKSLIKEKIERYHELQNNYIEKYDEANQCIDGMINVLQELLRRRRELR